MMKLRKERVSCQKKRADFENEMDSRRAKMNEWMKKEIARKEKELEKQMQEALNHKHNELQELFESEVEKVASEKKAAASNNDALVAVAGGDDNNNQEVVGMKRKMTADGRIDIILTSPGGSTIIEQDQESDVSGGNGEGIMAVDNA